jgi:hypothetical protein
VSFFLVGTFKYSHFVIAREFEHKTRTSERQLLYPQARATSGWRDCSVTKVEDEVLIARLRRAGVRELFGWLGGVGTTPTFRTGSCGVDYYLASLIAIMLASAIVITIANKAQWPTSQLRIFLLNSPN